MNYYNNLKPQERLDRLEKLNYIANGSLIGGLFLLSGGGAIKLIDIINNSASLSSADPLIFVGIATMAVAGIAKTVIYYLNMRQI